MGTTFFHTSQPVSCELRMLFSPHKIRMFTADHEGATVALSVPADMAPDYDAEGKDTVTVAVVIKGQGWTHDGPRDVSEKTMGETVEPYYSPGVNAQLLRILSPTTNKYAQKWRRAAWAKCGVIVSEDVLV